MRKPELEDKIIKLLKSSSQDDVLIAIELMQGYEFEDIQYLKDIKPSQSATLNNMSMYMLEKSEVTDRLLERVHIIKDIEIDVWQTLIFFTKL